MSNADILSVSRGERMGPCRSVLVPTDFSKASHVALNYGLVIADQFSSTLHVLHVVTSVVSVGGATFWGYSESALRNHLAEGVMHRLEALLPESDGPEASLVTRVGHPVVEIVRYAVARNVDLIVMGTYRRGLVGYLPSRDVVERVVRTAPCPVLAVPLPEQKSTRP